MKDLTIDKLIQYGEAEKTRKTPDTQLLTGIVEELYNRIHEVFFYYEDVESMREPLEKAIDFIKCNDQLLNNPVAMAQETGYQGA
jgi:hypothetical protein